MATVYIGVGSNLGERRENCLRSMELLQREGLRVTRSSSLFETEPWGLRDQPDFINMVLEAETGYPPDSLLRVLRQIEQEMGRTGTLRWGPRVIDLDILLYDDMIVDEADLKIPHPSMHLREFVLEPLCEIAPEKMHPVLRQTARELLHALHGRA